jgi:hypothetical protein
MNDRKDEKSNVIDITDRVVVPDYRERLKHLKVRLDLEQAKLAISTSLLSIVLLVTLANNNIMTRIPAPEEAPVVTRGIASMASVSEPAETSHELVAELSQRELSDSASIGRRPSSLEKLRFGTLEGKYAVRLQADGKLHEIEFSDATSSGDRPKHIEDFAQFLESNREILPVEYDKSVKISSETEVGGSTETYQLVSRVSMPLAKVQFRTDSAGRLLAMRIAPLQIAAK